MSKKDKTLKGIKTPSRRKFFKAAAATGAVAAATLAMPSIAKAATSLKVQAAWGGGIFLENAQAYVKRVNEMSGGALKIDLLAVNSVVKTSQMQDAVHRGVLDGAHYVPAYWYSKAASASLFGTGPCWGWSAQELLGWIQYGGGMQLFNELMGNLGLNLVSFFNSPMPAHPLGWFKEEIKDASQMKGLKYRTVGLAADVLGVMGMSVVQLPGGEIQPAMKSGLIDAALKGDSTQVNKIFNSLVDETTPPVIIISSLYRELKSLSTMSVELKHNESIEAILAKHRVWQKRKPLISNALKKHSYQQLQKLLLTLGRIDRSLKGMDNLNVYNELQSVLITLSGKTQWTQ